MNQFRKPRVVKDNFTTPRAVVSLRFFNCFRLLLEKAPRRRNYDNLADLMVISLEFNAMNWHLMVMLYPGDLRNKKELCDISGHRRLLDSQRVCGFGEEWKQFSPRFAESVRVVLGNYVATHMNQSFKFAPPKKVIIWNMKKHNQLIWNIQKKLVNTNSSITREAWHNLKDWKHNCLCWPP